MVLGVDFPRKSDGPFGGLSGGFVYILLTTYFISLFISFTKVSPGQGSGFTKSIRRAQCEKFPSVSMRRRIHPSYDIFTTDHPHYEPGHRAGRTFQADIGLNALVLLKWSGQKRGKAHKNKAIAIRTCEYVSGKKCDGRLSEIDVASSATNY